MPADQSPVISTALFSWDRVQHLQRSRHWRLCVGWHIHLSSLSLFSPWCFPIEHLCSWCSSVRTQGTLKHTFDVGKAETCYLQIAYSCIIIVWFSALYCSLQRSAEWLLLLLPYLTGFPRDDVWRCCFGVQHWGSALDVSPKPSFPRQSHCQALYQLLFISAGHLSETWRWEELPTI